MALGAGTAVAAEGDPITSPGNIGNSFDRAAITVQGDPSAIDGHTFTAIMLGAYKSAVEGKDGKLASVDIHTATSADITAGENAYLDPNILAAALANVDEDPNTDGVQNGYAGSQYAADNNPAAYIATHYLGYASDAAPANLDTTSATAPYQGLLRTFVNELSKVSGYQSELADAKAAGNKYDFSATATASNGKAVLGTEGGFTGPLRAGIYVVVDVTDDSDAASLSLPMIVGTKLNGMDLENQELGVINYKGTDIQQTITLLTDKTVYIGETAKYQLEGTVPLNPAGNTYKFINGYGPGLKVIKPTADADNGYVVKVEGVDTPLKYGTDYTFTNVADNTSKYGGSSYYTLVINEASQYAGKKITVTYSAEVNANFLYNYNGVLQSANHGFQIYNRLADYAHPNNQHDPTVYIYSYSSEFDKVDANGKPVAGAEFVVKNADGKYFTTAAKGLLTDNKADANVYRSGKNGKVRIDGLKGGDLVIEETKVADGFADFKPSFTVHNGDLAADEPGTVVKYSRTDAQDPNKLVTVSNNAYNVTVKNVTSITQLPLTGAAGIALFTVIAAALLGAGAFGAVRMRRQASAGRSVRA